MIYSNEKCGLTRGLNLSEIDVRITYRRYINNYKNTAKNAQSNDKDIDDAVRNGLTPGNKFNKHKKLIYV